MSTNYRRGADFERRVQADMERRGWVTVRAAGSHTVADVYAFLNGRIAFIQCKRNGRLYPKEWNELLDCSDVAGAEPIMAAAGENGRGIKYFLLTGRKYGGGARQPMVEWLREGSEHEVQESEA